MLFFNDKRVKLLKFFLVLPVNKDIGEEINNGESFWTTLTKMYLLESSSYVAFTASSLPLKKKLLMLLLLLSLKTIGVVILLRFSFVPPVNNDIDKNNGYSESKENNDNNGNNDGDDERSIMVIIIVQVNKFLIIANIMVSIVNNYSNSNRFNIVLLCLKTWVKNINCDNVDEILLQI